MDFRGMSADSLERIAEKATELARQLRKEEPTYELALASGVRDKSYKTVRCGIVSSYSGEATIIMENGTLWIAKGHGPTGGPSWISRQGYIEFTKLDAAPQNSVTG